MKKIILIIVLAAQFIAINAQQLSIIPEPVSVQPSSGFFVLKNNFSIGLSSSDKDAKRVGDYLVKRIFTPSGYMAVVGKIEKSTAIRLRLFNSKNKNAEIGMEGYLLNVYPDSVSILANAPAGLFYGVQTFLQLLPKEIERKNATNGISWSAPCVQIKDYPRFVWRGMMFDVARHFFTKEQVKEFIDEMVRYKYNRLHWHLTDDQGWRIEIKSLPNLTKVGAWRAERVAWGEVSPPTADEPRTYGGFYTQDDIREVIQYAKDNFVEVLPEIEMPGHALAFIASYPDISGTPITNGEKYEVNSGEKLIDWSLPGHPALIDNTISPANEKAYEYIDKVFTEVAQLFPLEYIHMGGDECSKNFWQKSDAIAQLMKKEKLKDMNEVQSYFVKRVEKIILSKGKKMIGWDEILEGGLAPSATVMSWRGIEGGIEATKLGHAVIMTPNTSVYIDLYQGDPLVEPPTYSMVRLNQSYQFEPAPDGVDQKLILGGQANLWSERIQSMRSVQYMTYPRSFAISESLWSPKANKNWNSFVKKVETHFGRFDAAEMKYSTAMYDCIFKPKKGNDGKLQIELGTEIDDLDIYFTFDDTNPDNYYPKYNSPLTVPKDVVTLKVVTYRGKKQIGKQINMPIAVLMKRAKIQ